MGNEVVIKTKKKVSGKERLYMRSASHPLRMEIPTEREIKEVMDGKVEKEIPFVKLFPGNHEGLIWAVRQELNKENYKSFIYLLTRYARTKYNPSDSTSWQFLHNVRKVKNKINNGNIELSRTEKVAFNYMLEELPWQATGRRIMSLTTIIADLEEQYGIFSED